MKSRKLVLAIIGILICVSLCFGISCYIMKDKVKEKEVINTYTDSYIAYLKINPFIKLNYQITCIKYDDESLDCKEPLVESYELVNKDAQKIFKNINILANSNTLIDVIDTICDKIKNSNIKTDNILVESNWQELDNYLNNQKNDENKLKYNIKVDLIEEEKIKDLINKDIKTEENNKKEITDTPVKEERDANTIYLKDNVTYSISGKAYCCEKCFNDNLINSLKTAKGYYVTYADSNRIDYRKIDSLSNPYNDVKFFGNSMNDQIEETKAEECGGLGGGPEALTLEICKQHNLICK